MDKPLPGDSSREHLNLRLIVIIPVIFILVSLGVGLLAIYMARVAKHVYAIEVDPAWSWAFTKELYRKKPANLTWIFGTAESVASWLRGDVAVIYTRSGQAAMEGIAKTMCPKIVWGPRVPSRDVA